MSVTPPRIVIVCGAASESGLCSGAPIRDATLPAIFVSRSRPVMQSKLICRVTSGVLLQNCPALHFAWIGKLNLLGRGQSIRNCLDSENKGRDVVRIAAVCRGASLLCVGCGTQQERGCWAELMWTDRSCCEVSGTFWTQGWIQDSAERDMVPPREEPPLLSRNSVV